MWVNGEILKVHNNSHFVCLNIDFARLITVRILSWLDTNTQKRDTNNKTL